MRQLNRRRCSRVTSNCLVRTLWSTGLLHFADTGDKSAADWPALLAGWARCGAGTAGQQVGRKTIRAKCFNGTFDAPPPTVWMRVSVCGGQVGHWTFCAVSPAPPATRWHLHWPLSVYISLSVWLYVCVIWSLIFVITDHCNTLSTWPAGQWELRRCFAAAHKNSFKLEERHSIECKLTPATRSPALCDPETLTFDLLN